MKPMNTEIKWDGTLGYLPTMDDFLGRVFHAVWQDDDTLMFRDDYGTFKFYHQQDCCESVWIESIVGDLDDLVGSTILVAEEVSNDGICNNHGRQTWTFYKFATRRGYVDIRWCGESNGYYSESVDLRYTPHQED